MKKEGRGERKKGFRFPKIRVRTAIHSQHNFSAAYIWNIRAHTAWPPVSMFHEPRKICESLDGESIERIHDPVSLPTPFPSFFIGPRCGSMQQRRGESKRKKWKGRERERERNKRGSTELAFWPFDGHPEIEFPLGR